MHPFEMKENLPLFPLTREFKGAKIGAGWIELVGYLRRIQRMGQTDVPEQGVAKSFHLPVGGYRYGGPFSPVKTGLIKFNRCLCRILCPVELPLSVQ